MEDATTGSDSGGGIDSRTGAEGAFINGAVVVARGDGASLSHVRGGGGWVGGSGTWDGCADGACGDGGSCAGAGA